MPIRHKSTPGPRGVSCLTCRQRRKKCDRSRPHCQRCLNSKGNFICLGYDEVPEIEIERPPRDACTKARPVTLLPPLRVGIEFKEATPGSCTRTAYFGTFVSASEINDYLTPCVDTLPVPAPPKSSMLSVTTLAHQQDLIKSRCNLKNIIPLPLPSSIPRRVNADRQMRESYVFFILGEYESYRAELFFRSTISLQELLKAQKKRPPILAAMYLGAKVFEAFSGKPEQVAIQLCSHWVTQYANHVTNPDQPTNPYPSTQEMKDRLNELLELAIIQSTVFGTAAGYTPLRLALSSFLHLVSDDPTLCVEQGRNGLLCVSLPAALTSHRAEFGRFVFHDIMCSLALGLPTLAEYDSVGFPIMPGPDTLVAWIHGVHGIPIEMIINISEVHNWRTHRKHVDWVMLEMRALAWRWRRSEIESKESAEMVYRAAIQEAWRHTTLIYIYMGMCGVTSHDPRVQASVYQIVKLIGVVVDMRLDIHFSIPCVVAGVAARCEHQRAIIIRKLKSFTGMRFWKIPGRDLVRILEHLWHRVAADGTAITWEEYVEDRSRVLPI